MIGIYTLVIAIAIQIGYTVYYVMDKSIKSTVKFAIQAALSGT